MMSPEDLTEYYDIQQIHNAQFYMQQQLAYGNAYPMAYGALPYNPAAPGLVLG